MTNEQLDSFRERRLLFPRNDGTAHVFDIPYPNAVEGMHIKKILKEWIATCSTGEFYLGQHVLAFYSEKDAMMFKLADYIGKATTEYMLKKEVT